MRTILIMAASFFFAVGVTEFIGWIITAFTRCSGKMLRGYHVIPVYDNPNQIELQLRHSLGMINWNATNRSEIIILADMGLSNEGKDLCNQYISKLGSIKMCSVQDLPQEIILGDILQKAKK